jgi:sigma-54 dependent transcriptional regulator, flagellar regulatory protein
MQITALKPMSTLLPKPIPNEDGIVCAADSPVVDVIRACTRIANSDATVLLTGETGTGKEVFARMVHTRSVRSKRPFVPVNCAAIPDALLESELFGYVRGAFTGAVQSRRGRVAMAEGGTLFLDEVGDLPLPLQVKLLRLLQNHSYEPVGSSESVTGDFRLVAATNRDLSEDVRSGRFRRDLYYRLHVCPLVLPPLRDRRSDIAPLFFHFWHKHGETRTVAPAVMRQLENYPWPGNVRELENLAERLSVCAESPSIILSDLPSSFLNTETRHLDFGSGAVTGADIIEGAGALIDIAEAQTRVETGETAVAPNLRLFPLADDDSGSIFAMPVPSADEITAPVSMAPLPAPLPTLRLPVDLPRLLRETEEAYIRLALDQTGGNKKEAAHLLGMGRTTLVEKLRRKAAVAIEKSAEEN